MCVFARGSSDEAFLLEPGKSRGTAGYMSPEHAKGKPLDKRTVRRNVLRLMPSLTIPGRTSTQASTSCWTCLRNAQ